MSVENISYIEFLLIPLSNWRGIWILFIITTQPGPIIPVSHAMFYGKWKSKSAHLIRVLCAVITLSRLFVNDHRFSYSTRCRTVYSLFSTLLLGATPPFLHRTIICHMPSIQYRVYRAWICVRWLHDQEFSRGFVANWALTLSGSTMFSHTYYRGTVGMCVRKGYVKWKTETLQTRKYLLWWLY